MRCEIVTRNAASRLDWNALVEASMTGWLWHLFESIDALATWPGKQDISFAIRDEKKLLAVFPLFLHTRGVPWAPKVSRLESMGGLCVANDLTPRLQKEVADFATDELKRLENKHHAWDSCVVLSPLTPFLSGKGSPKVNPLLGMGFKNTQSQSWMLDLSRTELELFANYSSTTRNEIRKIQSENPTIRVAEGKTDLDLYYQMHDETYRRSGLSPHPYDYFSVIFSTFVTQGLARILFLERNGKVVAAQNTALYKKGAYYWTGASISEKAGGESKYLCHLQILHAKSLGCRFYEVGEAFPNLKSGKAAGLSNFKRSFGGELYPFYRGTHLASNKLKRLGLGFYHLLQDIRTS